MSKRALKLYLKELKKSELEAQILDLYERFKDVKTYYDFAFNPNEQKLIEECKFKIGKEYFPTNRKRPKARRSVAQKYIKHFITLGVDPALIADVMLYNIEIAQTFSSERFVKQDSFYTSMLKSFEQAVNFIIEHGLIREFSQRLIAIADEAEKQLWSNQFGFERLTQQLHKQ